MHVSILNLSCERRKNDTGRFMGMGNQSICAEYGTCIYDARLIHVYDVD